MQITRIVLRLLTAVAVAVGIACLVVGAVVIGATTNTNPLARQHRLQRTEDERIEVINHERNVRDLEEGHIDLLEALSEEIQSELTDLNNAFHGTDRRAEDYSIVPGTLGLIAEAREATADAVGLIEETIAGLNAVADAVLILELRAEIARLGAELTATIAELNSDYAMLVAYINASYRALVEEFNQDHYYDLRTESERHDDSMAALLHTYELAMVALREAGRGRIPGAFLEEVIEVNTYHVVEDGSILLVEVENVRNQLTAGGKLVVAGLALTLVGILLGLAMFFFRRDFNQKSDNNDNKKESKKEATPAVEAATEEA